MTAIPDLCRRGVRFRAKDGKVQLRVPAGGLSADERAALRSERDCIFAALNGSDDADRYLAHLLEHGPRSYGAVAYELGWAPVRAWRAEEALRSVGRIIHDKLGRGVPANMKKDKDGDD